MSNSYSHRRKRGSRAKRLVLLIVCEGETEKLYFERLRPEVRWVASLNIEIPQTKERDPLNLVKYAQKLSSENGYSITHGDQIWLVFDMDEPRRVRKAVREAKKYKYNVALSIPSVELWYLLHYEYLTTSMDSRTVEKRLKHHLPHYKKTDPEIPSKIRDRRDIALENAKKLLKFHEMQNRDVYEEEANPLTHIFELVEFIINH